MKGKKKDKKTFAQLNSMKKKLKDGKAK